MFDDDVEDETRGPLWRVLGAVISVVLVSKYVLLAAGALLVRTVFGVAGEAWRRLRLVREHRRRSASRVGAEPAST